MACGEPEVQLSHQTWDKPVKLNMDELFRPPSTKKMTQRQLFASGRNVMKDIQNKAAARKTISAIPKPGLLPIRRPSETYKAPSIKPKSVVSRPIVGQSHQPSYRRDSQMIRRKTQLPLPPGRITNAQISASSTKKENSHQNGNRSARSIPSRQAKVIEHIPRLANLENSVNLLNVDDVEDKLVKEASLLKSQVLKQIHKTTREGNGSDMKNEQNILNDQINEKLKNMDEKLDKTLNELTNLKEIIKNLSSNHKTECGSCVCHCHPTYSSDMKSCDASETNNLEHKEIQPTSDEPLPGTDNCVPDSESETYSVRRSLRLHNKGAQIAYDSLRKSTKLLATPRPGSVKKTNTPGRLTRKVIAQLNDLYHD